MNNFKHIWTVICQRSIVASESQTLSLIDVVEKIDINLNKQPNFKSNEPIIFPFQMDIISFWRRLDVNKDAHAEVKVILISPEGKELFNVPVSFKAEDKKRNHRTILNINGFPITISGEYKIEILQTHGKEHVTLSEVYFELNIHDIKTP